MSDPKKHDSATGLGFSFNATGRDDTSTEILEPQVDPGTKLKRFALIAVVLLVVSGFALWTYAQNSALFSATPEDHTKFNAPSDHKVD